jgi:hypothetical protein
MEVIRDLLEWDAYKVDRCSMRSQTAGILVPPPRNAVFSAEGGMDAATPVTADCDAGHEVLVWFRDPVEDGPRCVHQKELAEVIHTISLN